MLPAGDLLGGGEPPQSPASGCSWTHQTIEGLRVTARYLRTFWTVLCIRVVHSSTLRWYRQRGSAAFLRRTLMWCAPHSIAAVTSSAHTECWFLKSTCCFTLGKLAHCDCIAVIVCSLWPGALAGLVALQYNTTCVLGRCAERVHRD